MPWRNQNAADYFKIPFISNIMEKWRVPNGPGTHVLMDGGILSVPPDETTQFYETCVGLVNSGTKLYVVEQKTERFKFFVDFDYKSQEKLEDQDLLQFCSIIHQAIGSPGRCVIARARVRPVGEGLLKSGVHIHWPDLVVTRTEALNFRTKIITGLGDGPWDQVIDAAVYGGSGLRMLWSHKKPTGDPYIPWRQLDGPEFSKAPNVETLALFAVRTDEAARPAEILQNTDGLERFVQRYIEGQSRARIKKVQRSTRDGWFAQTDSRWCANIKREHASNHVWFSINGGKISQKCLDEECREFQGPKVILPPSIVEQLEDVAIVGSPSSGFLMDIFPNGSGGPFQEVRANGPSIFGPRSGELEALPDQHPRVRTVGFDVRS